MLPPSGDAGADRGAWFYAVRPVPLATVTRRLTPGVCGRLQVRPWIGLGVTELRPLHAQHAFIAAVRLGGGGVALCNLGMLCIEMQDTSLAREVLLQAQCVDPSNEAMWIGHGLINEQARGVEHARHPGISLSPSCLCQLTVLSRPLPPPPPVLCAVG